VIRLGPAFYVATFFLLVLVVPPVFVVSLLEPYLTDSVFGASFALLLAANLGVFVILWHRNSVPGLSLWASFKVIAASMMSGCAGITIVYIYPVLSIYYLGLFVVTAIGLMKDSSYSRIWWEELVAERAAILAKE
jgi:hypothetical protein